MTKFIWNIFCMYVSQCPGRAFAYEIELPAVVEEQKKIHVGAVAAIAKNDGPCTDFEAAEEVEEDENNVIHLNVKVWVEQLRLTEPSDMQNLCYCLKYDGQSCALKAEQRSYPIGYFDVMH